MFDFQSAIAAANAVVEKQENQGGGGNYTYPLVYPQAGHTITVRPLFNPKSGQILRLVNRHEKVACYKTYGIDCPICKVQQQVKDMTGQDPFGRSKKSKSRGICFAQYVSSTNQIDKGNNKGILQPGEIILFMFPWSVYSQINTIIQAISQTPTGMDQAFCHSQSGLYIQINVSADFKYTTTNVPYMTFPTQQSDDDFMKMLEEMESLSEQVLPSSITEDVDKQVREYTDAIYRQFVAPSVPNQAPPSSQPVQFNAPPQAPSYQNGAPQFTGYNPTAAPQTAAQAFPQNYQFAPAPQTQVSNNYQTPPWEAPQQSTAPVSGHPACFGKHVQNDPKCICCPDEMVCMSNSQN